MQKIILYYEFVPIADPAMTMRWQHELCRRLDLRGRIIISPHGINGTLGGKLADLKTYIKETKSFAGFKDTIFKWSDGGRDDFPRLSVKVRDEIVSFGAADELRVNESGVVGGGQHLKPGQIHELVERYGDDVVFFDGRNKHEAAIGRFKQAVVPDVATSKDFIRELDSGKYDELKSKKVITYCTGGIRCEILSSLMKNRGFQDVYQLDGGIVSYGDQYGDDGLWEGQCYVFDKRLSVKFSEKSKDIGHCAYCQSSTSRYSNCAEATCNALILGCDQCQSRRYCPDCLAARPQ